jgi:hypothetical protein
VNVASVQRVEVALAACAPGDTLGPAHITDDIQLSIVAIGHLSKGFSPTLVNTTHPALGTALLVRAAWLPPLLRVVGAALELPRFRTDG